MKKPFLTLLLFISSISFAQGIAVQGIARDNTSSAITDANLTFTFSITKDDNTVLYAETQSIKTDNFGVFSHIVKNGNPVGNLEGGTFSFSAINFSIQNLKMKVSVKYNNTDIEVYNQTFQYTPYAHFAENAANGVPTGAIMPFIGAVAPTGWALCNGNPLPTSATKLIAMVGTRAPDLRGMFLRGAGKSTYNNVITVLKDTQGDGNKFHKHAVDLSAEKNNSNNLQVPFTDTFWEVAMFRGVPGTGDENYVMKANYTTNSDFKRISKSIGSQHNHRVFGVTGNDGIEETRPVNYGVNYIIKL
jgi:microcystin-dependent protein